MRCGVLWLIACLVAATRSQFLIEQPFVVNVSEVPNIGYTEISVDRNDTFNDDDNLMDLLSTRNSSTSTNYGSNRIQANISDTTSLPVEPPIVARSRTKETNKPGYIEITPPHETEARQNSERAGESSTFVSSSVSGDSEIDDNGTPTEPSAMDNERIEQTTHGPVKGYRWKETDIYAFLDIPYGKVDSPFEAPHSAQSWIDVHEVKEHNTRCPQFQNNYMGDINCLTLSIFAPANVVSAGVLFYVHDSSFGSGDPKVYGPEYLVSKGVILVLPNYRIGALGFLCLQNETALGNAGLKDLTEALKWTRNNIVRFGGNPSNVVVGGDGDAGALAGYLALCSPSKPYIKKVITESGSMLSHLALDRYPLSTAARLAVKIRNSHSAIYNNTFAEASVQIIVEAARGMRFNPCIEHNKKPFMSVSPWTLLQNTQINTTFMIGSASHAGAHEAVAMTDSFIEQLNADYRLILPGDLIFTNRETRDEYAHRIKTQYFGDSNITRSQMTQLSLLSTDTSYLSPLIRSARPLVNAGATVYLYEFEFMGHLNLGLISLDTSVEGAVRNDIIGYLFTQNGHIPNVGTPEERMVNLMVDLWVSFIKTGTPTAENIKWKKMKSGEDCDEEFLQISSEPELMKGMHVDRLRLWTELYNEFFIERSFALSLKPEFSIFIIILFWITNTK